MQFTISQYDLNEGSQDLCYKCLILQKIILVLAVRISEFTVTITLFITF